MSYSLPSEIIFFKYKRIWFIQNDYFSDVNRFRKYLEEKSSYFHLSSNILHRYLNHSTLYFKTFNENTYFQKIILSITQYDKFSNAIRFCIFLNHFLKSYQNLFTKKPFAKIVSFIHTHFMSSNHLYYILRIVSCSLIS